MKPKATETYVLDAVPPSGSLPGALEAFRVGARKPAWVERTDPLKPVRRAKIVCTMGPACVSEEMITALIEAGMNVARLNFSHGTHAEHAATIQCIRRVAKRLNQPVALLQDLQGPKIRMGTLAGHAAVELRDGMEFTITTRQVEGTAREVSTTYADLPGDVQPGDTLLLDDGLIELRVERVDRLDVRTRVVHGGLLKEHKGINLPGVAVSIPILTEKDLEDLAFGVEQGVDYVAVSFVSRAEDIVLVQQALADLGPAASRLPVIAKLEKPAALTNLEAILEVADGVMVARGDLAVELSPQLVPPAQKRIIQAANQRHKIVITATQMLESMTRNPRPTRAEASDVANAIYDGTDAVMLSAETASGDFPVEAVKMMAAIIEAAEDTMEEWGRWRESREATADNSVNLARAVSELVRGPDVAAIAAFTCAGREALHLSKVRARVPILAFTPEPDTYARLALLWGVLPQLIPYPATVEVMLGHIEAARIRSAPIHAGQQVVLVAELPAGNALPANFILLHTVRAPLAAIQEANAATSMIMPLERVRN
jgi:pyruvate kinase